MQTIQEMFLQLKSLVLQMPKVRILDVLDVAIVSYLIYKVINWIKETRAWTLFKGIMVVFLMVMVAFFLQLNTILWIFQNTISVGIIAIIILFQPELRRALEKLGTSNILSRIFLNEADQKAKDYVSLQVVEEIVDAAKHMSRKNTGALIVIEQEVRLGEYEETGIELNAAVTSELLINIFEHNTPLHDGAVIIKNNLISSATCYLPMSENTHIKKALGTRHRAAVGISEISDSVVVIVSEETGAISIARDGELIYDINMGNFRNQLINEIKQKDFNKKKFVLWKGRGKNEK